MKNLISAGLAAISLSVLSFAEVAAGNTPTIEDAMIAAGRDVFEYRCQACHSADPAKNAFGPSLIGIVGREAGSLPRYAYSRAMMKADVVWTEDNLRGWISNNEKFMPGTRMRHVAITDAAEQDFLIAFLRSLK